MLIPPLGLVYVGGAWLFVKWRSHHAQTALEAKPGLLSLTAMSGTPFKLQLETLTLANISGHLHDFDAHTNYTWRLAAASGGITGFSSSAFQVDTTGIANAFNGTFNITSVGNDLLLRYQVVPEPAAVALLISGATFLGMRRRRSANNHH